MLSTNGNGLLYTEFAIYWGPLIHIKEKIGNADLFQFEEASSVTQSEPPQKIMVNMDMKSFLKVLFVI